MGGTNSYYLFNDTGEDIYFVLYEENNIIGSKLLRAGARIPTYLSSNNSTYTLRLFRDAEKRVLLKTFCVGNKDVRVYIANGTYMADDSLSGGGNIMSPSACLQSKAPSSSQVHNRATLLILALLFLAFIIFSLRRRG